MIFLGLDDGAKEEEVTRVIAAHNLRKVFICSPARFAPAWAGQKMADATEADGRSPLVACDVGDDRQKMADATEADGRRDVFLDWPDIQRYVFFYKLMQEVDENTLLVVNECLRTQNRHDLTYNCIRNFALQTPHVLVFQYLPILDTWADFAALFDFDTKSRWKREKIGRDVLGKLEPPPRVVRRLPELHAIPIPIDAKTAAAYAKERASLLAEVKGDIDKDPHVLPRNLLLVSGKAKGAYVARAGAGRRYVGRNDRLKLPNLETYREATGEGERVVFELPHNFGDFIDFLTISRQTRAEVLVADTKADRWYWDRYQAWAARVSEAYEMLGAT